MNYRTEYDEFNKNYIISSNDETLNITISKVRYNKLHKEGSIHKTIIEIFNTLIECKCNSSIITRVSNKGKISIEMKNDKKSLKPELLRSNLESINKYFNTP